MKYLYIKKLNPIPTIIATIIFDIISFRCVVSTIKYKPAVFKNMLPFHTKKYLMACLLSFPSLLINVQFLFNTKLITPPQTALIKVAATYHTANFFESSINTEKSDAVARAAIILYLKNDVMVFGFSCIYIMLKYNKTCITIKL